MEKIEVKGFYLGERIDLKTLKNSLTFDCIYEDPTELIYKFQGDVYFQVFDYGSIIFFGVDAIKQTDIINSIRLILDLPLVELQSENFDVEVNPDSQYIALFDRIVVKQVSLDMAKIVMLNIAQSVALDNYVDQSDKLLNETLKYSAELETKGEFSLRGKKLFKFIGRTLNLRNKIANNLYIFDSPILTWEDEYLNRIYNDLRRELDISLRYRSLQENLEIIQENLEIYKDLHQHSHSATLEWIVIILIAVEIANAVIERIL
jgi:required for meiotic nuclear division protein 1